MSASLAARTALVTGASRGIGAASARALAAAGASVIVNGRHADTLDEVARDIEKAGGTVRVVVYDMQDVDGIPEFVAGLGPVDVLLNNAATQQRRVPLLEPDQEYFDATLRVNLLAPLALIREVGRGMVQRGRGSIVNISSLAAKQAYPGLAHYCIVKSAIESLTRVVALEFGPHGVRCNAIAPGFIDTAHSGAVNSNRAGTLARIPLGRAGEPEDIARVVVHLASDDSAYVNGTVITVDGGSTAGMLTAFSPSAS